MTIKCINNFKIAFVTTIFFISILTVASTPTLLLPQQQVLGSSHLAPDLPLITEVCKHDTNPNGPSCKPDID